MGGYQQRVYTDIALYDIVSLLPLIQLSAEFRLIC